MVVKQTKQSKTLQTTADVDISCTQRRHCYEPTQISVCFSTQWRETNTADQTRLPALTTTPAGALLRKAATTLIRHDWHPIWPIQFDCYRDITFRHDHRHHHFCRIKFVKVLLLSIPSIVVVVFLNLVVPPAYKAICDVRISLLRSTSEAQ